MNIFLFINLFCTLWVLSLQNLLKNNAKTRIIGGENAWAGQYKFFAAIYVQTQSSKFFCGGSLITNQWVLTSGHCVYNATLFTIHLGSITLADDDPNRTTVATSEYVLHPGFNPETIEDDIGLIKFRMSVMLNGYIQLAFISSEYLPEQTIVTAVGYGQISDYDPELSNNLQFVSVTTIANSECKVVYGNQITENMVCVAGNYNEGTCIGDNGGPLVEHLSRYYWLVGVASFISSNGCENTDPSGFTRLLPYANWIKNITSN